MKHDLYPIIIKGLKRIYNLKNKDTNHLYRYLYARAAINYDKKEVDDREAFKFILDELNLSTFNDDSSITSEYLYYKGEKHYIINSNMEFRDNFIFRAKMKGHLNIEEELKLIFKKGYQKAYKYRGLKNYGDYRKYNRLVALNEHFEANPVPSEGLVDFATDGNHNPFKRTLEEMMDVELKSSEHKISNTTVHITERNLEDYLINNLELIEKGLTLIKRQVSIPGGFIDILAKDKNGSICIIELKIEEDKSIIWQSIHYPKEVESMYRGKDVRMLTIAPSYSKSINDTLKSLGNVETFKYDIEVASGSIVNLKVNKY